MNRTYAVVLILISLAIGSVGRGAVADAQSRMTTVKYSYVIGVGDRAFICYAESSGCRMEPVTAEPVMMTVDGRTVINGSATQGAAFAKAVAQLGVAGWEMIGPGPAYGTLTADQALHFKLSR